ncbi:MAG: Fe(3+) ABC transporter substrate-binding protein [Bacteroidota bacterium]
MCQNELLSKSVFKMYNYISALLLAVCCFACASPSTEKQEQVASAPSAAAKSKAITLYTHRHYDTDQKIFDAFTQQTGISVNVVKASADELIQKMEQEGAQSPADLLLTVDAGRLVRAEEKDLLQPVSSAVLTKRIPSKFRAKEGHWFGLTKRARVIVYDKKKVDPATLSTYEALADSAMKGRVLIRQSNNIYNQSLLASIIAHQGQDKALAWAKGVVENFARSPQGNDRDQVKAILAGEGDIAVINTYYLGKLLNSKDAAEVEAGQAVGVFFPNQDGRGTHVNISGIGVAKYAPNKAAAIQFIEYLTNESVQATFAKENYEYPINAAAASSDLLKSWGDFKEDDLPLAQLGKLNKAAVITFDQAGWK